MLECVYIVKNNPEYLRFCSVYAAAGTVSKAAQALGCSELYVSMMIHRLSACGAVVKGKVNPQIIKYIDTVMAQEMMKKRGR